MVFAVLALAPVNSLKIYQHENMKSAATTTTTSQQQIVRFRPSPIFTVPSHLLCPDARNFRELLPAIGGILLTKIPHHLLKMTRRCW